MKWLKNLVELAGKRWRKRQRDLDVKILWPEMKRLSLLQRPKDSMEVARRAFLLHALHDEAWTADYTDLELTQLIYELE